MTLQGRLQKVAGRLDAEAPANVPASEQWLNVLRICLPLFQEHLAAPARAIVVGRITRGITLLEAYQRRDVHLTEVEQVCRGWFHRTKYSAWRWRGRELAFEEEEYDRWLARLEQIVVSEAAADRAPSCNAVNHDDMLLTR